MSHLRAFKIENPYYLEVQCVSGIICRHNDDFSLFGMVSSLYGCWTVWKSKISGWSIDVHIFGDDESKTIQLQFNGLKQEELKFSK